MSERTLCPHVTLEVDADASPKVITARGAVYPYFSWSREIQADVPRLKCSHCGKAVKILGYAVRRARPFLEDPS